VRKKSPRESATRVRQHVFEGVGHLFDDSFAVSREKTVGFKTFESLAQRVEK